jgi:hypothetical protein
MAEDQVPDLGAIAPDDHWNVPKIGDWELARSLVDHSDSIGITTPQYTALLNSGL